MPLSWTRSDPQTQIEKGAILLLLVLLALCLGLRWANRPGTRPEHSQIRPKDAFQRITLGHKLHINSESAEGLMAVPKMTEKMAKRIVEFRERYGKIADESDLRKALGNTYKRQVGEILAYVSFESE